MYNTSKQNPSEIISFVKNLSESDDSTKIQQEITRLELKFNVSLIDSIITINCECDFIEYLYTCGAKVSIKALNIASCHGELELVELLYSFLSDISREAIIYANRNGHYHILDYLYSKNPELFNEVNDIVINEASTIKQDIQLVEYLISKGIRPTEFSLKYSKLQNNIDIYNLLYFHFFTNLAK